MVLCPSLHVDFVILCKRIDSFWFCKCAGVQTIIELIVWLFLTPPFFLFIALRRKKRKKRNACIELLLSTFWTLVFQSCVYVIISDSWLKLLMVLWLLN